MAESKLSVSVNIEKVAHDMFRELAQKLLDEHGLQVRSVRFDWIDAFGLDGHEGRILSVGMESRTR